MKYVKKLFILLFFSAFIITVSAINPSAKSSAPISPALSVIAEDLQMKKCGLTNTPLYLSGSDFDNFFAVDKVKSITVNSLPSVFEGTLYLGNTPVIANQRIYRNDLNKLCFVPVSSDVAYAGFRFSGDGLSCESSVKCSLFLLPEINTAPVITQSVANTDKIKTQKNIMVYSTLSAEDNENDKMFFEVCTEAKHGIVNFTDEEKGFFSYTPAFDFVGEDSFEYTVTDEYGNRSEKARVTIKIEKNNGDILYSDMMKHTDHLDAVKASNYKIMSGKYVNGQNCFLPDKMPTRAEFVRMALKASGIKKEFVAVDTDFADDSNIPVELKGYVSYAVSKGYISGTKTKDGIFFYPNETITRADAAVLISNILNAELKTDTISFDDEADIPTFARDAVQTLAAMNIMGASSGNTYAPQEALTNIQAAKILCKVYEYFLK